MAKLGCMFNLHEYEVLEDEESEIRQIGTDMVIGKVIVSRCKICGDIRVKRILTVDNVFDV